MSSFNDDVVDAGNAFIGMAISDGTGTGNVQLWNPLGSGKNLYIDKVIINTDMTGTAIGADIRFTNATFGSLYPDPIRSKAIDGAAPSAQIYTCSATPPNNYPYNKPIQEVWLGAAYNDRAYTFDPAIKVPQGHGVVVSLSNTGKCFASWQWREIPTGVVIVPPPAPGAFSGSDGTLVTSMTNGSNAFDGNQTTYASDTPGSMDFYIGKTWTASRTVTRFTIMSPSTRSFAGANPGRTLTWMFEVYDGTNWALTNQGTFTEGSGSTQSVIDITLLSGAAGMGHRVHISESAIATHEVSEVVFYGN